MGNTSRGASTGNKRPTGRAKAKKPAARARTPRGGSSRAGSIRQLQEGAANRRSPGIIRRAVQAVQRGVARVRGRNAP